jgi:hypothetical protein
VQPTICKRRHFARKRVRKVEKTKKMTCHGIDRLKDNGTFQHNGAEHRKFVCLVCHKHYGYNGEIYYPLGRTSTGNAKIVFSGRATKKQLQKVAELYGTKQQFLDAHLPNDD